MLFVNATEINEFKAKDFETNPYQLYLGNIGNISKYFTATNMKKKTGLNEYIRT